MRLRPRKLCRKPTKLSLIANCKAVTGEAIISQRRMIVFGPCAVRKHSSVDPEVSRPVMPMARQGRWGPERRFSNVKFSGRAWGHVTYCRTYDNSLRHTKRLSSFSSVSKGWHDITHRMIYVRAHQTVRLHRTVPTCTCSDM